MSFDEKYNWIEFCLKKNADPNVIIGEEPIILLLYDPNVNKRIVELLLDYDSKVDLRDNAGILYLQNEYYNDVEGLKRLLLDELN